MKLEIKTDAPPLREDLGGAVRVGPTRVTLESVLALYERGESPEEIVEAFDTLPLADVYSVIGCYLRHQAEVDTYLRQIDERWDEIRRKNEADPAYREWRERLLARRAAMRESGTSRGQEHSWRS